MIFDDHDVTDDWNLGRAWRDRVFTAPLGRRIIMSALVAYVVFQDWGNDPKRYHEAQGVYRDLLDQAFEYQPRKDVNPPDRSGRGAREVRGVLRVQPAGSRDAAAEGEVALLGRRTAPPRRRARHAHAPLVPLAPSPAGAALAEGAQGAATGPERAAVAGGSRRPHRDLADADGAALARRPCDRPDEGADQRVQATTSSGAS